MRATFHKDVTSGVVAIDDDFSTVGPNSVFHIKNEIPPWPESQCYILAAETCSEEQYAQVINGTVRVENWIVVEYGVGVELKLPQSGHQKVLAQEES